MPVNRPSHGFAASGLSAHPQVGQPKTLVIELFTINKYYQTFHRLQLEIRSQAGDKCGRGPPPKKRLEKWDPWEACPGAAMGHDL